MKSILKMTSLACIIFLSACQSTKIKKWTSDDLIISDQASLMYPQTFSSSQATEDTDFLIFALSTGYGGRKYVPGDSLAKALKALRDISNVSSLEQFHDQMDSALFTIPDNHLIAYYKSQGSNKRSSNEKNGNVGRNNITDLQKIWEVRVDRIGKKKVLYIFITRFPDHQSEIWNGFIESISSQLKKSDSIVLDLRGNSGGDDTKGMQLAEMLFGHAFEHPIKRQYRSQTPETMALVVNKHKVDVINLKYDGLKTPDYLIEKINNSQERYNMSTRGELPTEFIRTDKGTGNKLDPITGYKKPIYILMDGPCGSSCEFTIAAFEWHKYAQKVGENTNGTFHFSNTGIAVLPNSKIKNYDPNSI